MSKKREQYILRFPEGLRSRLKEMADASHRSLNSEMIYHLERAAFDPLAHPDQNSRPSTASGQLAPASA